MPLAQIALNVTVGGITIAKNWTRSGEHPNPYEVTLPVAQDGDLTTRTDDDTGVATMDSAEHGIETGDKVDVYWDGGVRYGMEATVSGTAVTLEGGAGAVLPADESPVVVCVQVDIPTQIDGDVAQLFVVSLEYADSTSAKLGHVDFQDAGAATIAEKDLEANVPLFVDLGSDLANLLTGNPITSCKASHNDTANEATLKIATLEDF